MQNFSNLVNKDKYQVFMLGCKAHFPFGFFRHAWFVVNQKGKLWRIEVRHYKNKSAPDLGHLFLDALPPFEGINTFYFFKKPIRATEFLGIIEGDEGSPAQKLISLLEESKKSYPFLKKYFVIGTNSNTYPKWVFSNFPELKLKLPWNYIGKGCYT